MATAANVALPATVSATTMDTWKAITKDELEALIELQLNDCSIDQKKAFEKYRVPLRPASIVRYGMTEQVFIVAQNGDEVMYYEDVEDGFNFSPLDSEGQIAQHWCNKDEIKFALWHWMGKPHAFRMGPAVAISTCKAESKNEDGTC